MRSTRTCVAFAVLSSTICFSEHASAQGDLTPVRLQRMLAAKPSGAAAAALVDNLRAWFGGAENLKKGPPPKLVGLDAAFAIETDAPGARAAVVSETGRFRLELTKIEGSNVYAASVTLPEGFAIRWAYEVNGQRLGGLRNLEAYAIHPDSITNNDRPHGELRQMPRFRSRIFEGTSRDWWVFIPSQYRPENPACVMVFQDGASYRGIVQPVFENLIAKGEMPVTIAVMVNPGTFDDGRSNRSFEYDSLSDRYVRMLIEEILPEVEKQWKLKQDPASRAIGGASSGGICAFTAAWERPDAFSKVMSWIGSFTNIQSGPSKREGGHNYPALIRKTEKKPIRVFLQAGENDLDNEHGNWPLANHQMEKALAFKGYDYKAVWSNGFHSYAHGVSIFPDTLRWLWRQ